MININVLCIFSALTYSIFFKRSHIPNMPTGSDLGPVGVWQEKLINRRCISTNHIPVARSRQGTMAIGLPFPAPILTGVISAGVPTDRSPVGLPERTT
jgi:hypothetical protein